MNARKVMTLVSMVLLVTLVIGPALAVPALADPSNKVMGVVKGTFPAQLPDGSFVIGEFMYQYNIIQVGDGCAAKGWATFDGRLPGHAVSQLKVAIDCVEFMITPDGKKAAVYSGRIEKAESTGCEWNGQLKIGKVIDGGDMGGDKIIFWWPLEPNGCFYPDLGVPLNCTVPPNSMELDVFTITEGDVEVRFD